MLTVTVNATINAPLDQVFAYVTTAKHWPEWNPASLAVSGDIDHPIQSGFRIIERFRYNGTVGDATWTVIEHVPLKKVVFAISGYPVGNSKIAYAFEEDRREVRFTRSLVLEFAQTLDGMTEDLLDEQERSMERDAINALTTMKRILEATR